MTTRSAAAPYTASRVWTAWYELVTGRERQVNLPFAFRSSTVNAAALPTVSTKHRKK